MKHTPTPWAYDKASLEIFQAPTLSQVIEDAVCPRIATVDHSNTTASQAHADGEYIVLACNAHDELVAIIKTVEQGLRTSGNPTPESLWAVTNLQAALAKVEGQS